MKKTVDAMGDACPIPVVKTKKVIEELKAQGGTVETFVDNEIAVQNLTKLGKSSGYSVLSEKLEEKKFRVEIQVTAGEAAQMQEQEPSCIPDMRRRNTVVVISSQCMGEGDPELGTALMKSYIYALSQQDQLPSTILFYNSGVKLACQDAPTLEDLKSLEAQGVEILACGTCLNFYGLSEKLQAGSDRRKNEPGIPDHQAMIRERKPCVVLTFSTTTAAMSMEKRCGEHKIPGRLIPVPREITAGCGLAWKMPEEDYEKYKDEVESLNITVEQKVWLKL